MTVIIGLLQFVGATVILIYGVEESSTLTTELNEYLIKLVYDWDNDPKAAAVLKQIMEYVSWKSEVENGYGKLCKFNSGTECGKNTNRNLPYTLIPSAGPTGNFYQRVYFNKAGSTFQRCVFIIFFVSN